MLAECLLQLAEEGITHECGGLFPQLLQLLLGQISLQAEVGAVDGQVDVFRKALDFTKDLAQRGATLENQTVGKGQGKDDLQDCCHPQILFNGLWRYMFSSLQFIMILCL